MAKIDCGVWTPWEQSLREEYKDWESDKARWEVRFDKKMNMVLDREVSALAWEKEVTESEGHLASRGRGRMIKGAVFVCKLTKCCCGFICHPLVVVFSVPITYAIMCIQKFLFNLCFCRELSNK